MSQLSITESLYLKTMYYFNQIKFFRLKQKLKSRVSFGENCQIWEKNFQYRGKGKIYFGKESALEKTYFPTIFDLASNAEVIFGERVYLRGKYAPNVLTGFENAKIIIGDGSGLNGCVITARNLVRLGKRVLVSWRVSIMDSDLHDLSNTRKAEIKTVEIGDYVLIGAGAIILPGVKIGSHSIIGAGAVVSKDIPEHSLVVGVPAKKIREIDNRDLAG